MTTISREEFEELVRHDAALLDALRACPDPKTAWETAGRLAAERGYRLAPAPERRRSPTMSSTMSPAGSTPRSWPTGRSTAIPGSSRSCAA